MGRFCRITRFGTFLIGVFGASALSGQAVTSSLKAGCYAMSYSGWSDPTFWKDGKVPEWQAPPLLRFDSESAPSFGGDGVAWRGLAPTTTRDGRPLNRVTWSPVSSDSVLVYWMPYRSGMFMHLEVRGDTLIGTGRAAFDIIDGSPPLTVQIRGVQQAGKVCPTALDVGVKG